MATKSDAGIALAASLPSVASELKRICSYWPAILNSRDIAHVSPKGQQIGVSIDPAFEAHIDGYSETFDWNGLRGVWQKEQIEFPEHKVELVGVDAQVDERNGAATVYMEVNLIGLSNILLKGVTDVTWIRSKEGRWSLGRFRAMRAHAGNTGFV